MSTFYLIRHGSNDMLPRALAGRLPEVHLNAQGRTEAGRVADLLGPKPIRHILSSPMDRCRETAEPLARRLGLPVQISEAINEVDFGEWQGGEMPALKANPDWRRWIRYRSGHRIPGGEIVVAIQARVVSEMLRCHEQFPGEHIALFSHGDPIRAALCHWLGMPLDFMVRLEVAPGSVNIVRLEAEHPTVLALNWT